MGLFFKSSVDIAIIGLGNIGEQYAQTRHNMGFVTVDKIAQSLSAPPFKARKQGLESKVTHNGKKILLVKPTTFMNESGNCVREVMDFYKLTPERMVVIYDDIDLGVGGLRLRPSGGAGTHNGMRSIVPVIGEGFIRVRVGIGKPQYGDLGDYVLARIPKDEQKTLSEATDAAADAAIAVVQDGIERAMQSYNRR
ncbi:MAG: aminoacyl-tRNA hydrolase [Clostridia bacterium]|nr:aminoacyl-tRNA hydrolase [Clostridia bacterium]